ncbi:hypothetical protein DUNSADRAFT_17909 [Dunaliella salina]|uniref:guanylate cyclase n=1 Tax=Dunaliella salina TaxID=3046 RepID=A0ABQ7H8Z5_DUNSA|nr:hypothetical protein DUNSADRAFT_17909 [Dunaliella salina]|eukprot:KAF5843331.1 hypothetical protein DUNSADRAFT_17909 [Dunaliella salina]
MSQNLEQQHEAISLASKMQAADKSFAGGSLPNAYSTLHPSAPGQQAARRNWTSPSLPTSSGAAPSNIATQSPSIVANPLHKMSGSVASAPPAPLLLSKNQVLKLLWRSKCLQHPNIVPVIGIVWSLKSMSPQMPIVVRECQELGSVASVLENQTMVVDTVKQLDIAKDVAQALAVIHAQEDFVPRPVFQPQLTGVRPNKFCRAKLWVPLVGLSDVVLPNLQERAARLYKEPPPLFPFNLDEPEHIGPHEVRSSEELDDVRSYGVGMAQLMTAGSPAEGHVGDMDSHASQQLLEDSLLPQEHFFSMLAEHGPALAQLLAQCCSKDSQKRPSFAEIVLQLEAKGAEVIQAANEFLRTKAQGKSLQSLASADELLYDLFPEQVANALKNGRLPDPEPFPLVSIFFSDVCGYTNICSCLDPPEVMYMLHRLYSRFDDLARSLKLFKVETVGDAYLCVANLKHPQPEVHARLMAEFAFGCLEAANNELICPSKPELGCIHIRVGLHTGAVMGAVVGTLNRRFGLFGDTVNVASRMESSSIADHIHCSAAFIQLLHKQWPESAALTVPQGTKEIKGKGTMHTYMLYPAGQVEQARAACLSSNLQQQQQQQQQQLAHMSTRKTLERNASLTGKARQTSSLAS